MRTILLDIAIGCLLALGVLLAVLCSTFHSTFVYQGF